MATGSPIIFASIMRKGILRFIKDHEADLFTQRAALETRLGRALPAVEDCFPPVEEIARIAGQVICEHGCSPLWRCKECMVVQVMAATIQRIFEAAFDEVLDDAFLEDWAADLYTRRERN